MLPLIVLLAVATYALWYLFLKPDDHLWHYGNLIPGPKPWPIIGNIFSMAKSAHDELNFRGEMIQKYGHVNRIWASNKLLVVCLSDPKDAEVILKSTRYIKKSVAYKLFRKLFGNGLFLSEGQRWMDRRKTLTPTFHLSILNQYMESFDKSSNKLIDKLKAASQNNEVDMFNFLSRYMLDIICETAMGIDSDALDNEHSTKHLTALHKIGKMVRDRAANPILLIDFFWKLFGDDKSETENVDWLRKTAMRVLHVKEQQLKAMGDSRETLKISENGGAKMKKRMAFLEMILRMKMDGNPSFQSNEDVYDETNTFFFASHDTTAVAACFTLESIADNPSVQEKVYEEIRGNIKDPSNITMSDLHSLTYLESVLKESLRLFPPIPLIGRQMECNVELPSGYTIPAGATVLICIYYIHRHPHHYDNPLEFNPDNFSAEAVPKRNPYAFIPFSAGPRNCLGQRFAMLEVKMALAKILYNFKIRNPQGAKEKREPYGAVVLRVDDHTVFLERR